MTVSTLRPFGDSELIAMWRLTLPNSGMFDVCLHKASGRWTVHGRGGAALRAAGPETDEERQMRIRSFVREVGLELTDGRPAIEPERLSMAM